MFIIKILKKFTQQQLLQNLKRLRIIYQQAKRQASRYVSTDELNNPIIKNTENENKNTKNSTDGRWIILENWSECDVVCGGGKSYLKRICIPPKNGGKACEGNAILEKNCNTILCPVINKEEADNFKLTSLIATIHNETITNHLPIKTQTSKYIKCVVMEQNMIYSPYHNKTEDLLYKNIDNESSRDLAIMNQTIVKVFMNNISISIYHQKDFHRQSIVFNIKNTNFEKLMNEKETCFVLSENEKMGKLCPLASETSERQKGIILSWEKAFKLFKYSCAHDITKNENNKLLGFRFKSKEGVKNAKTGQTEIDRKAGFLNPYKDLLKDIDSNAAQALIQEVTMEELIKRYEIEKEREEEKALVDKIEAEKAKKVKLSIEIKN